MCAVHSPRSEASGADFLGGDSILELSHLGPGPALPLIRGISDMTNDSDGGHGMEVDMPTARWTPRSAGLWPVRAKPWTLQHACRTIILYCRQGRGRARTCSIEAAHPLVSESAFARVADGLSV